MPFRALVQLGVQLDRFAGQFLVAHIASNLLFILAERGRFELPKLLRACRFSRPVHSTALPPLRSHGSSRLPAFYRVAPPGLGVRARLRLPVAAAWRRLLLDRIERLRRALGVRDRLIELDSAERAEVH